MADFPTMTHVAVTVTDLTVSVPWYKALLGSDPVLDEDTGPFHHTVFLHTDWRFLAPVKPGDEITAEVEVIGMREDKPVTTLRTTVTDQDGRIVLDGKAVTWSEPLPTAASPNQPARRADGGLPGDDPPGGDGERPAGQRPLVQEPAR